MWNAHLLKDKTRSSFYQGHNIAYIHNAEHASLSVIAFSAWKCGSKIFSLLRPSSSDALTTGPTLTSESQATAKWLLPEDILKKT